MSETTATSQQSPSTLVILGVDTDGKPHASRFSDVDRAILGKAAQMMKMHLVQVDDEALGLIAAELPEGKIFATGRGLVPFVRRGLYDKLASLIGTQSELKLDLTEAQALPSAPPESERPRDLWDEIGVGSVVLARSPDPEEGWYDVVVLAIADNDKSALRVRWRDYPNEPQFDVDRHVLALTQRGRS